MTDDNLREDGTPAPPGYPLHIAHSVYWYDDGCGMGGVYYEDCGGASEIPAAIWSEHELLLVVNHMRKIRGADPIIPMDFHMIPVVLQCAATHLAGAQYRLSNEKMIEQVERVLIDIADQHRAGLKTQEFWTRTAAEVLSELKNPPPSQAGDMWLDTNEYDLWGGFPPTDEPPKDSHD